MSDVYYTFQDIANNPDYSDIDAIAQIKKVMSQPTDDAEQFVARKLKLMHDTIAKHPSYKNDPMGVYEEMLDMIRTEYHDETYESKEMNPTTQTFSEDNDTNSLEQWKADVRKQYPQQASQIKFKGKGFGDTIVAEIPGKDQAFGEFNMETGDAWVAPMDEGVAEGSVTPDVTVNKVHDDGHEKEWHIYRGKEMIGYVIKNQPDFAEGLYIAYGHGPGRAFDKEFTGLKSAVNYITSLKEGVAEALDKEGDYHVSVQKGKFLPSDRGGGSDENLNYLHDLMNISGTGGGPMLVTISDPRIATEVAAMYGGKVLKTRYGTYRIVQSKGQNQKTPTPEPELVGMREDGVAEATGDEPFDKMMTQIVKGAKPNTPKRFIKNIKKVAKIKYKFQVGDWVTIDPNEIAKWPTSGMIGRISRFSSDGDAVVNVNPGGGASGGGSSGTHTTVPTSMLEKLAVNLDEPGVAEGPLSEKINPKTLTRGFVQEKDMGWYTLQAVGDFASRMVNDPPTMEIYARLKPEADQRPQTFAGERLGKQIGSLSLKIAHGMYLKNNPGAEALVAGGVDVDTAYQRKGVASAMYQFAKELGNDVIASVDQSDDAVAMWKGMRAKGVAEGSHSESDEELENFLDSTKPELDRLYKLAKTSKKAKAAYYELKEKWDDANSKLYGLDEQGVAEGSVLDTDTTGYTKYDMAFVNNESNQIKKIQAKLLKIPGFTRKVNDNTSQLQLAEKIFNLMKRGHTFDGALVLAQKNPSLQGVAEGPVLGSGNMNAHEIHNANEIHLIKAWLIAVVMALPGTPEQRQILNWQEILSDQFDTHMSFATLAQMRPQLNSQLRTGQFDRLLKQMANRGGAWVFLPEKPGIYAQRQGVAEGSSSLDEYKRRLASIQSLRYDDPPEYAKKYSEILRLFPEEHHLYATGVQKGSYSPGERGSGTGRIGRVSEDSAQGTANKQAWDKGHKAGYTGNEKCPCKPGSAEEKAWNAGHKVGRDERSHERHGVKEGNMKSSENNPTGPSFAGGKWKGTDSAAQAKNKYVGEISEGTMPSVKLMRNIAEGLVRVDDLVLNRPVYGKPTDQDRRAVYRMVREFADAGIDYNDAVVELVEYFKHELSELAVAPTIPAVGGKPATTTTTAPTGTPSTTANTAAKTPDTVSSTAPGAAPVVAPPVSQQGVDALAQMVKNAGLSPSQLGTLMSKAK